MAFLGRLPTRDRLSAWGMNVPVSCVLCSTGLESHQHLLFECDFAVSIWSRFSGRFIINSPSCLQSVVNLFRHPTFASSPLATVILKLLLQLIVYRSWRERNQQIFRATASSEASFFHGVDRAMRDRLLSLPRRGPSFASLLELYFCFVVPYS